MYKEFIKNPTQKKAYTYDALNRIISEKDIDKEQEICYTYDNNGNILTKSVNGVVTSYAYEEGTDRLTSYGAETIGYDGMGNPKSYRGSELTWEKGRRLTSIKEGPEEVTFGYDVFGQRNQKTSGGETTNYVYENGKLLRQITGSEVMTFIYGSEGIIGFKLGTSRYLYRKNVFGDVEEIYSAEGTLVGKYRYTAFGECEIETDANGIATKNPFRYRGYYYDAETGLYYLKTRYYDPETGRFITIDDISYLAPDTINGLNLYAYCGNNPILYVDYNGNFPVPIWLIIMGFAKDIFMGTGVGLLEASAKLFAQLAKVPLYLLDDVGGVVFNPVFLQEMTKATKFQYAGTILNSVGKVAKVASYALLVVDVGFSIYNNFTNSNLSTSRKITDSVVDVGFSIGGFFASMAIGSAIGSLIPIPIIGSVIGAIAGALFSLGVYLFQ